MKIELIDQDDQEQMEKIKKFAATFDHRVDKCGWPLYMVHHNGKPIGYFHLVQTSLIHPAMSHESTPREIYEAINEVRLRVSATGPTCAVLVPNVQVNFTPGMMGKLGFYSTDHTLWTTEPKT